MSNSKNQYQPLYFQAENKPWYLYGEIVPKGMPLTLDQILGMSRMPPKGGFDIVRVPYLAAALEKTCKVPGRVLAYLLSNRIHETNYVHITTKELAAATGVSVSTIVRLIDQLEEAGLAIQIHGSIWLNPQMIHRGGYDREKVLLKKYNDVHLEKFGNEEGLKDREDGELEISSDDSLIEG